MKTIALDVIAFAQASALEAIDQRDAFGGVDNAVASYRENVIDWLAEEGVTDAALVQQALDTFDTAAVFALRALPATVPGAATLAVSLAARFHTPAAPRYAPAAPAPDAATALRPRRPRAAAAFSTAPVYGGGDLYVTIVSDDNGDNMTGDFFASHADAQRAADKWTEETGDVHFVEPLIYWLDQEAH